MSGLAASKSATIRSSTSFSAPPVVACVMRSSVCAIAGVDKSSVANAANPIASPSSVHLPCCACLPIRRLTGMLLVYSVLSRTLRSPAESCASFLQLPDQSHTSYASSQEHRTAALDFYEAVTQRLERQHGPLAGRLRNALAGALEGGALSPGEALPSEREMAERFDVSRSTLRQSLKDLAQMGLLATRPGMGTVVARPHPQGADAPFRLHRRHAAARPRGAFESAGTQHRASERRIGVPHRPAARYSGHDA